MSSVAPFGCAEGSEGEDGDGCSKGGDDYEFQMQHPNYYARHDTKTPTHVRHSRTLGNITKSRRQQNIMMSSIDGSGNSSNCSVNENLSRTMNDCRSPDWNCEKPCTLNNNSQHQFKSQTSNRSMSREKEMLLTQIN